MSNHFAQKRITSDPYLCQSHQIQVAQSNAIDYLMFGEGGVQNTVMTTFNQKNKVIKNANPSDTNKNQKANKININKTKPTNRYITSMNNIQTSNNYNINNPLNNNQVQISENKKANKVYQSKNISSSNPFNKQPLHNNKNNINSIGQNKYKNADSQINKLMNPPSQKIKSNKNHNNNNSIYNYEQQNKMKESQTNQNYSFSRYTKPALTGLKNLGDTSYLNSILQMFCSIRNVASYFLNPNNGNFFTKNIIKYPIAYVVHRLCTHLYPFPEKSKREIYTPDSLMEVLSTFNIVYGDYKKKNPVDFIVFFFNILHKELNLKKTKIQYQYNSKKYQNDKNKVIQYGISEFKNNYYSIISNFFTWFYLKRIQCTKCSNKIYSFGHFQTFDLNISSVEKFKKTQNIKLSDCLDFYQLNLDKQHFFCEYCKCYSKVAVYNKIYTSPNYFVFLLDINENKNINFMLELVINLEGYIESKNNMPTKYELNGIVFFDKEKNKYNALCKSPIDKNWYLYDDENVQPIKILDFLSLNNNNKNNTYRLCILLYNSIPKK